MPDGTLVTYGVDGRAIIWRADDFSIVRSFDGHHARVEGVDFVACDNHFISVGDDGRLLKWSPADREVTTLFATHLPLMRVEFLAANCTAVIADAGGSVWHVRGPDDAVRVRSPDGDRVTLLRASTSGRFVVIGTAAGQVSILDSDS